MSEQRTPESPNQSTPKASSATADDRTFAMLAHVLGVFTWFLGALIIWLVKKDQSKFVEANAREAMNFQLTVGIGYAALAVMSCLTHGLALVLYPIIYILNIVFSVLGCVEANKGRIYRYPVAIRLIK